MIETPPNRPGALSTSPATSLGRCEDRVPPLETITADQVSRALQNLPRRVPRPDLRTSLRVIASRERQRKIERQDLSARWRYWRDRMELWRDELIRPFAVPFTGGVFSAILLFFMFVPPLVIHGVSVEGDIPTMLTTQAGVRGIGPFSANGEDLVLDILIDDQGRMIDYRVVTGAAVLQNAETRRRLENMLLFASFIPATQFGQPTTAKIRLWFQSSHIDVKG